jgi:2-isopropylmalate synthase
MIGDSEFEGGSAYEELMHSWAEPACPDTFRGVVDETIRDGLQMPYLIPPDLATKLRLIDHMIASGISDVIVGMVQRDETEADLVALLRRCGRSVANIRPWVLARLDVTDLETLARLRDRAGIDVGANIFISLSPLRRFVEGWAEAELLRRLDRGLAFAGRHFAEMRVAFEDATRTPPGSLAAASRIAADHRVTRVVLADTAGIATPETVDRLFEFVRQGCPWLAAAGVAVEWHGHNDRGLAVANTLKSIACGAHYVHGTMLGIGERNGNAALDSVLLNLSPQIGFIRWEAFFAYQRECQELFGHHLEGLYPFFGQYTFATGTGTHCAAVRKALLENRPDLAILLYSPPSVLSQGARPRFLLSPMSGRGAALALLEELGIEPSSSLVDEILSRVRRINATIDAAELKQIVDSINRDTRMRN